MDAAVPLAEQSSPAAEPFYASGTFWTIVGIVVAIALGAWAVWAAFRSARPRRSLYIDMSQAVSLLRTAPGLHGSGLTVSLRGQELTRPYVATVDVISSSALDIAPGAFGGSPLELEFGVPVVALLDQGSHAGRPAVREPKVEVVGTALHISPALLTRRHWLRYTVLLDGKPDFRPVGDLVDVAIHVGAAPVRMPWTRAGLATPVVVAVTVDAIVIAAIRSDFKLPALLLAALVCGTLTIVMGAAVLWPRATR